MTYMSRAIAQFWKLSLQNAATSGRSVCAMQLAQDALCRLAECEEKLEILHRHLAEMERQSLRGQKVQRIFDEMSGTFGINPRANTSVYPPRPAAPAAGNVVRSRDKLRW
jgi:hypothetical protein